MRAPLLTVVLLLLTTAARADQPPHACPPGHQHCPAATCPQFRSRDGMLIAPPYVARTLDRHDSTVPTVKTSDLEQAAECCKAAAQRATPTCPVAATSPVEQACTSKKACCKSSSCNGVAGCAKSLDCPDAIATDQTSKCSSGKCCQLGQCAVAAAASDHCCEKAEGTGVCCTQASACAVATDEAERTCCRAGECCKTSTTVASGSYSQEQLTHLSQAAEHLTAAGLPEQATGVRDLADKLRGQLIAHKTAQIESLLSEVAEIKGEDSQCAANSCCGKATACEVGAEKKCCRQGECALAANDADAPCGKATACGGESCETALACKKSSDCAQPCDDAEKSPTIAQRLAHLTKAADYLEAAGCSEEAEHLHALVSEARHDLVAEKVNQIEALQAEIAELRGEYTASACCESQGDCNAECEESTEDDQRAEAPCPSKGNCPSQTTTANANCGRQVAVQIKMLQVPLSSLQSLGDEAATIVSPDGDHKTCQLLEREFADALLSKMQETGAGNMLRWPAVVTTCGRAFEVEHPETGARLNVTLENHDGHHFHVTVRPITTNPQSAADPEALERQARIRKAHEVDADFELEFGKTAVVCGQLQKRVRTVKFVGPLSTKTVTTPDPVQTLFLVTLEPAAAPLKEVATTECSSGDCPGNFAPSNSPTETAEACRSNDDLADAREQARQAMKRQLKAKVLSVLHSGGQFSPPSEDCESDEPCAAQAPHCEVASAPNVAHAIPTHESPKQVAISVKVVEVSLSKLKQLGFAFASFEPGSAPTLTDSNFASFLTALERENLAKSLSSSVMIVTEGRPGSLTTGGRVAVPVLRDDKTVGFQMQEIGTHVDARATLVGPNRVHLDIRPRLTQVHPSTDVSAPGKGTPRLCVRELDSSVEMEFGQTAVLGGLVQQRTTVERHDRTSQPEAVREEVQTFFVVTPKLIESASPVMPASHQQPACATDRPAAVDGRFDFNHSYHVLPHPPLASPVGQPPFRAEVRSFVPFEAGR